MKIAIVSSVKYHIECAGFLLASLVNEANQVILFTPLYITYGYERYFKSLYDSFEFRHIKEFNSSDFDVIIKLTAHDKIKTDSKKTISIVHKSDKNDNSKFKITLTPYVELTPIPTMLMPIYQGRLRKNSELQKEILWIGQLENLWIDEDLITFVKSVDYHFTFVISTGAGRGNRLRSIPNLTLIHKVTTDKMIELILKSDIILCRKLPFQRKDRFSGTLALGLSHNKPMIMNREIADDYGIPGIVFEKNYSELTEYVNQLDIDTLNLKIDEIVEYREKTMIKNQEALNELINTI